MKTNKWPIRPLYHQFKDLDRRYLSSAWSESNWKDFAQNSQNYFFNFLYGRESAKENPVVIGFSLFLISPYEDDYPAHLVKLVIAPKYRRKGLGYLLAKKGIKKLKEMGTKRIFLEVEESNFGAVNIYQSLKFQTVHLAKNYYGQGKNALKMLLVIE